MSKEPNALQKAKDAGEEFEILFEKIARLQGMYARKIPLSCRAIPGGQYLPIDSELDFQLISEREIAFVDTKSFSGDRFVYSQLKEHQVKLSADYNYHGLPSGFCIYFRDLRQVVYFPGEQIYSQGPRSSFEPSQGRLLGGPLNFDLKPVFNYRRVRKARRAHG